jgi:hypothetical protein
MKYYHMSWLNTPRDSSRPKPVEHPVIRITGPECEGAVIVGMDVPVAGSCASRTPLSTEE